MLYRKFQRRNFYFIHTIILFLVITGYSSNCIAGLVLDNSIIHFEPGKPNRSDVGVSNNGNSVLYVQVTPYLVENPGTAQERKVKVTNPKQAGLLVSPNKLAIKPGSKKLVRFVNLNKQRESEAVYRVEIKPVTGKLVAKDTGLKIMIGYEVLVLAQPDMPIPNLVHSLEEKSLVVKNTGNTNIMLMQGKQCPPETQTTKQCIPLQDKRIYPGMEWAFELEEQWPAQFQVASGSSNTRRTFD